MIIDDTVRHATDIDATGEFRSGPEAGSAPVGSVAHGVCELRHAAVDDLAIFEGDIVLGTTDELDARRRQERVAISGADLRPPNARSPPSSAEVCPTARSPNASASRFARSKATSTGPASSSMPPTATNSPNSSEAQRRTAADRASAHRLGSGNWHSDTFGFRPR